MVGEGAYGSAGNPLPSQGIGSKLIWYPENSAFRAGYNNVAAWDNTNIGDMSFAGGNQTIASAQSSTAFGEGTKASGQFSTALGNASIASGIFSLQKVMRPILQEITLCVWGSIVPHPGTVRLP